MKTNHVVVIVILLLLASCVYAKMNEGVDNPVTEIKNRVLRLANVESSDTVNVSIGKAGQIDVDGSKISVSVIEIVRRSDGEGAIFYVGEIKARKKVGGKIPLNVNGLTYNLYLVSISGNSAKFRIEKGEKNES